jgi:hypothetical protein
MVSSKITSGLALFLLTGAIALAQEDPEALYAKMHGATLAGNTAEVLGYGTATSQAELAPKSQAEKDAVVRGLARVLPKSYTITEKTIAPDGNSAVLRATGTSEAPGRAQLYLDARFVKEGGAWKAASWSWTDRKPPPPAQPAVPATSAAKDAGSAEPPPNPQVVRRLPGTTPVKTAEPEMPAAARPVAMPKRPSRAHLDARECLKLPTDRAIMACAEKFR